jgi:phosphopantothenoylcysteine decarboxylase/phosphopantothenate--cysteine ligase
MNQAMWADAATQHNLALLRERKVQLFGPDSGEQACGDVGPGRMLEPQAIAELCAAQFAVGALAGVKVTITAGPTREAIDPVRYLSNHSSGKMGYALAQAAVEAGAAVTLISGPVALAPPERVTLVKVESAQQMLEASLAEPGEVFIAVAAVADYRPAQVAPGKIKKQAETLTLELVRNPDILATIAQLKPKPFCVGFAAETDRLADYAKGKLRDKQLDMIFANDAASTFGADESSVTAYWDKAGQLKEAQFERASKALLARELITLISANRQRG